MNQQMNMNVDINQAKDILCKCGGNMFIPIGPMKHLSALQSPAGVPTLIHMLMGYQCTGCGSIITYQLDVNGNYVWLEPNSSVSLATGGRA